MRKFHDGRLVSENEYDASESVMMDIDYQYDNHGRREIETDASTGDTIYTYFENDLVESIETPETAQGTQITTFEYDERERQTKVIHPDDKETHYRYHETGELRMTWGARAYPVEYSYDGQGRLKTMTTWSEFDQQQEQGVGGEAVTEWKYHPQRGWMIEKEYEDGQGPTYEYYDNGQLKKRTWARGVETDYQYNNAGDLKSITYSDDTPGVSFNEYSRLGELTEVDDGNNDWRLGYTYDGRLSYEANPGSNIDLMVRTIFDDLQRVERVGLWKKEDGDFRWGNSFSHYYSYEPDSSLLRFATEGDYRAWHRYPWNVGHRMTQINFQKDESGVMDYLVARDNLGRVAYTEAMDFHWLYWGRTNGGRTNGVRLQLLY